MSTDLSTRIPAACAVAQHAFWNAVATEFPEVVTDDVPPIESLVFRSAMTAVVTAWLRMNVHRDGEDIAAEEFAAA